MDRKKLNQIAIGIALFAIVVLVIAMLISGQAGRIWLPALSLAALIALVLLLLTDKKQPQAEVAAEETQTSAAQPELEQAAMIAGLAEDFDYIASADLEKNTITDRRRSPLLSECIDGWDDTVNFTAKMMLFADALVIPPEKESFLAKTDAQAIRAQLETCGAFYVDCPITLYGKERLYQLKLVSAAPDNSRVTIGFHSINDAAIKARRSVVQDIVMDGLTSDFECVSYVEFTGNRVTCCRISELFAKYIPGWRTVTDYAVRIRLLADALVVEEDRERFLFMTSPEQVMQGLSEDRVHYVVFRIRAEDATWIYQAKFISDPDDRSAVILGIHNVDREKKQEMERHAQEDAAHVRNEFFTQMSSDILGPLGSIQTVLHNARNNISDAENLQQSLEKADLTAQYLSGLISDVLDMTRENGGGADVVREPMNMRVFVERCAAVIEEQAAAHKLRLDCYFDDIVHPHVRFDVSHLRQIVLNLLNNAVKYTPEGGKITFRVGELIAAEETVTFKIDIADTGHGMDRDILEHIWDVFALRADTSGDDSSGTGLGLAVCKMLADKMGATIAVDSKVGEGSCFTILLPAELDREAEQTQPADDVSILNGMHVLLAEDNELSRNLLKELLADAGAIITDAENGTVALQCFDQSPTGTFDLVLMDNLMPEMNGVDATRAIRALPREDALTVPVIGMSTGISDDEIRSFRAAGINGYLEKPVQIPALVNALLQSIHSRSQMLEKELAVVSEIVTKDALTGVRNRNAYERMEKQIDAEIAAGKCAPFAYLFCDVNDLKKTNDTLGHERGDELIRSACRLICDVFKHSTVFRMGGDEFAAILHGTDYDERDALLARMDELAPQYGGVSVACGMTAFDPETDETLRSVYKRADVRMYDDKRAKKGIQHA